MAKQSSNQPADDAQREGETDMQYVMRMAQADAAAESQAAADAQEAEMAENASETPLSDSEQITTDVPVGAVTNNLPEYNGQPHLPAAADASKAVKQPWILCEYTAATTTGDDGTETITYTDGKGKNIAIQFDYLPDGLGAMYQDYLNRKQPGYGKPMVEGKPVGGWYTVNDSILDLMAQACGHDYRMDLHTSIQAAGAKAGAFFMKATADMLLQAQAVVLAPYATLYPLKMAELVLTFQQYKNGEIGASNGIDAKAWLRQVALECKLPATCFDHIKGWKNTEPPTTPATTPAS